MFPMDILPGNKPLRSRYSMIRSTLLLVAALASISPALAKDKAEDAAKVDPNKKVCRSEVATGTIMRKRVCHTPAEWQQIADANAATTRMTADRANTMGAPSSN
jgi:hypothetical protein